MAALLLIGGSLAAADDRAVCDSNKSKPDEAIAACTRQIESGARAGADLAASYFNRAQAWHRKEQLARASADFAEAIRLDEKFIAALCSASDAPDDDIIGACNRRIASGNLQGRSLAQAYTDRGFSWWRKKNYESAIVDYNEATRVDPKFRLPHYYRALVRTAQGDRDGALADLEEAIRIDPKYARAYYKRAELWQKKGDFARATSDLKEAVRHDLKYADSICMDDNARSDDVVMACTHQVAAGALRGRDLAKAFRSRGIAWRDKGNVDRAIADYNEAIRIDPKWAAAFVSRALARAAKGDKAGTIADYNEAIRVDPKYAAAYYNRGNERSDNDLDGAIRDYTEAILNNSKYTNAFFNRAHAWNVKGDTDRAIADYTEAIRLRSFDPVAFHNRGKIWGAKGDRVRAISDFTEAVRLDPGYVSAYAQRALAYERNGEIARARADFNTVLSLPANNAIAKRAHETARVRLTVLSPGAGERPAVQIPAAGSGRVALVIGNSAYTGMSPLKSPVNDARSMAAVLRSLGFEVVTATDLGYNGMESKVREFLRKAASARVALLYYSGHGSQVDGKNYLVPVDAMSTTRAAISFERIELDRILAGLEDESRTNIVILDACRNNPFEKTGPATKDTKSSGLAAYTTVAAGMLIAFATAPGITALDGRGEHSPFTASLIKHVRTPGLEIQQMLTRVRVEVAASTKRQQIPWVNSSLLGELYLAGEPGHAARSR
jgi:tetratricopeptide (TPR) repeat protein